MDSQSPIAFGTAARASDFAAAGIRFINAMTLKWEATIDLGNERLESVPSGPSLGSLSHRRRAEGHGL